MRPSVSSDRGTEVRNNERRTLVPLEATNPVAIGIDAAVVANHHVVVRRPGVSGAGETLEDFVVAPTLAGMEILTKRLSQWPGVMAVAEPTSMTWLPLSVALRNAGGDLALVGNRHSARLRSALAGKNKSDPIDAVVLSRAGELFGLQPARIPAAGELALRRAAQRRGKALVEANRCLRRVISLPSAVGLPRRLERLCRLPADGARRTQPVATSREPRPRPDVFDHRSRRPPHPRCRSRRDTGGADPHSGSELGGVLVRAS
jgi:hypothetical protein